MGWLFLPGCSPHAEQQHLRLNTDMRVSLTPLPGRKSKMLNVDYCGLSNPQKQYNHNINRKFQFFECVFCPFFGTLRYKCSGEERESVMMTVQKCSTKHRNFLFVCLFFVLWLVPNIKVHCCHLLKETEII